LAACIYVATCTRPTVRHVYSDRTRGDLQVAKNNFFCSDHWLTLESFFVEVGPQLRLPVVREAICKQGSQICFHSLSHALEVL
jgi:hypothetical protein